MTSPYIELIQGRNKVIRRLNTERLKEHSFDMPLFITGLPRSGTSFLHNLISLDPRMQYIPFWEAHSLQHVGSVEHKIRHAQAKLEHAYKMHPRLKTIHYNTWNGPEECMHLMKYSLQEPLVSFMAGIDWDDVCAMCDIDADPMYQFFKRTLNLIPAQANKNHWVFKCPTHMLYLRSLYKYFPTANVVVLIRDRDDVIRSSKSLMGMYRKENDWGLTVMVKSLLEAMDRSLQLAKSNVPESRITYLDYDDFIMDPVGTVQYLYDYFDYAYSNTFDDELFTYVDKNPKDRWGRHVY